MQEPQFFTEAAPYTYYCQTGRHSWSLKLVGNLTDNKPPAPDGVNLDCPQHACDHG